MSPEMSSVVRPERELVRRIWQAGLAAAAPGPALAKALEGHAWQLPAGGRLVLLAVGKAAPAMLEVARSHARGFGLHPESFLVTTRENAAAAKAIGADKVFLTGHPLPDAAGLEAAAAIEKMARDLGPEDQLVALISGGASALLPAPVAGLSLEDKVATTDLLLSHGLTIGEVNLVRQALSRLKGGQLARIAAPAQVESWLLSDVIGDNPAVIGSGPTAWPVGTVEEAIALLEGKGLWPLLPEATRTALERRRGDPLPTGLAPNAAAPVLIGSNAISVVAMAEAAQKAIPGVHIVKLQEPLRGDVADEAARLVRAASNLPEDHPAVLLAGGEPVVTLRGSGKGVRNQELALRFAKEAERLAIPGKWAFLAGGTDGRDGPTQAAGGLVDEGTIDRIRARGLSPEDILAANDSHRGLDAADDLFITGPTGTNVADLAVFVRMPEGA